MTKGKIDLPFGKSILPFLFVYVVDLLEEQDFN